jgi:hypothetical protein
MTRLLSKFESNSQWQADNNMAELDAGTSCSIRRSLRSAAQAGAAVEFKVLTSPIPNRAVITQRCRLRNSLILQN